MHAMPHRERTRVTDKTPEENRGWWWVQRRKRESTSEQHAANEYRTLGKLDRKLDLRTFRNRTTCYAARLSSPHAYIMLLQRGACGRTLGGSAKSELDTQCAEAWKHMVW